MEENKKEKKGKKVAIGIAIAAIVVIVIIVAGGYFVNDRNQKQALVTEIARVSKLDTSKETIDVNDIKTKGKYAKIEKAVKSYLNEYAVTLQNILQLLQQEQLANVLDVNNLKEDGPEFVKTKQYLQETQTKFDEYANKLTNSLSEESAMNYEGAKDLDNDSKEIYKNLLLGKTSSNQLESTKKQTEKALKLNKDMIDAKSEIINFLSENKDNWEIQGSKIMFKNQTLLNQYNKLIKKLQ